MNMKLFGPTCSLIERAMDLRMKRHIVLSGNVANSETPNYRARELNFAGELSRHLDSERETLIRTNPHHIDTSIDGEAGIVLDDRGAVGADGNNVDLDISMGKLSENARAYQGAANYMNMQLRQIRAATRGEGAA